MKVIPPYYSLNKVYNAVGVDADLIIIGNSRAQGHYNDSIMSANLGFKCINIGWSGYPFDYQYHVMYGAYMRQNVRPEYIITDISPYAFFNYVTTHYIIELLPYIAQPEFKFFYDLCDDVSYSDCFLLVRYAGLLDKIIKETAVVSETDETPNGTDTIQHFNRFIGPPKMSHLDINPEILNVFTNYIDECLAKGIKMIFVCSPMHVTICKQLLPLDEFWRLTDSITAGKDITILDYSSLFDSDSTYFNDPLHLNSIGQRCFSEKLSRDLDSMHLVVRKNY